MKAGVWAVICGTIRDQVDFSLILDYLLRCRETGKIQGIVLSTWEGEVENYPDIHAQLELNRVAIVTSKPNETVIGDLSVGSVNYWRQATQLQAALDVLPTDAVILKTRTDRAMPTTRQLIKMLDEDDPLPAVRTVQETRKLTAFPRVFEHQIAIFKARTGRLLQFADFSFMGYAADVRRLLNFDVANLYFKRGLVANIQFFIYPFIRDYPILVSYYRLINFQPLLADLKTYTENGGTAFPRFFERVYAVYFGLLASHFRIGSLHSAEQLGALTHPIEFSDFFHAGQGRHLVHNELGVTMNSQAVLDDFLQQPLPEKPVRKAHWWQKKPQERPSDIQQAATEHVLTMVRTLRPEMLERATADEIAELENFTQDQTFSPHNWLRKPAPMVVKQPAEYAQSIQYELPGINDRVRQELWEECERSSGASGVLYRFWLAHDIEPQDSAPYLLSSARTDNRLSILLLTRLLRQGLLSTEDAVEVRRINDFFGDFHMRHHQMNAEICCYALGLYMTAVEAQQPVDARTRAHVKYAFERFFPGGFTEFEQSLQTPEAMQQMFDHELERLTAAGQRATYQRVCEMALEVTHHEKYWRLLEARFSGKYRGYERLYRYSVQFRLL